MTQSPPLVAVIGPTGAGKSAFSLRLAAALRDAGRRAEIINADAMQLYRGMDIGTAKVPPAERGNIPHHMFDVLEPAQDASVSAYQRAVHPLIAEIQGRGAVPVLVGGSGLYINSVLYRMEFAPHDAAVRAELETELETLGLTALVDRLHSLDPAAAAQIDVHNPRRVIRVLEVITLTGKAFSLSLPETPELLRPTVVTGVTEERQTLTARLDSRVTQMWRDGLVAEVESLLPRGIRDGKTARHAIGYAQALAQLAGEVDEESAIAQTQLLTRRYARRQVSWFKRLPDVTWLSTAASCEQDSVQAVCDRVLRGG